MLAGHMEYTRDTLSGEYSGRLEGREESTYSRELFQNDDVLFAIPPPWCWSSAAALFSIITNYAVYQETPFDWRIQWKNDAPIFAFLFIRGTK